MLVDADGALRLAADEGGRHLLAPAVLGLQTVTRLFGEKTEAGLESAQARADARRTAPQRPWRCRQRRPGSPPNAERGVHPSRHYGLAVARRTWAGIARYFGQATRSLIDIEELVRPGLASGP